MTALPGTAPTTEIDEALADIARDDARRHRHRNQYMGTSPNKAVGGLLTAIRAGRLCIGGEYSGVDLRRRIGREMIGGNDHIVMLQCDLASWRAPVKLVETAKSTFRLELR